MKRRFLLCFAVSAIILSSVLSAVASAKVSITFSLWRDNSTWDGTMAVIEEFQTNHPDIEVNVIAPGGYDEKLRVMSAAGSAPDVMLSQDEPFQGHIEAGVFMDLTDLVERDKDELAQQLADYWPTQHEVCLYKGRYYGLPGQVGGGVLTYYNQDLFDKKGLVYPDENWTWNDLIDYGKHLTEDTDGDGNVDTWGLTLSGWWVYTLPWIWSAGGAVLNKEHTRAVVDSPEAIEGLDFYQKLMHEYMVAPAPGMKGPNWMQGEQGINFTGTWVFGYYLQHLPFNWNVAHLPLHPETKQRATRVSWNIVTISPQTKHLQEAWKFAKFFSSIRASEIIWEKSRMPFPPSVQVARTMCDPATPQDEEVLVNVLLNYGRLQPITPYWTEMERIIASHLGKLRAGQISAKQMAEQCAREINALFKEFGWYK